MSTSTSLLALLAILCLALSTLPLSHSGAGVCVDGSCDLDFGSAGCSICATNSSQCTAAYYNTPGQYCGQSVMTSQQSNNRYYYPACCPPTYPCVANSYISQQGDTTYDVTSFWCTRRDPATFSGSSATHLTWLWWLLACAGGSVAMYVATYLYRRHQQRTHTAAQQQQQWDGPPQQELLGQPGPWSDEAAERHQQAIRQPPTSLLPAYLPPGTYAQMP